MFAFKSCADTQVLDYFSPSNQQYLQDLDLDLGSTGPVNINDEFVVQVGKQGNLYALNISNLGGYNASNNNGNAYQFIPDVFIGQYPFRPSDLHGPKLNLLWASDSQ